MGILLMTHLRRGVTMSLLREGITSGGSSSCVSSSDSSKSAGLSLGLLTFEMRSSEMGLIAAWTFGNEQPSKPPDELLTHATLRAFHWGFSPFTALTAGSTRGGVTFTALT